MCRAPLALVILGVVLGAFGVLAVQAIPSGRTSSTNLNVAPQSSHRMRRICPSLFKTLTFPLPHAFHVVPSFHRFRNEIPENLVNKRIHAAKDMVEARIDPNKNQPEPR